MTEHELQKACIKVWDYDLHRRYGVPSFALFAIPNGGARNPIVGAKLKAEGVRRGVPDLCLAVPFVPGGDSAYALYMELKVGKNKLTPEQIAYREYLETYQNYAFAEVRSVDDFIAAIGTHLDAWVHPSDYIYDHIKGSADTWLRSRYKQLHGHNYEDREQWA